MRARFALLAAVSLAACSKPAEKAASGPPGPPADKLVSVVEELDELCGDTWCEGSYQFDFTKLECATATTCTLTFDATPESGSPKAATLTLSGFEAVIDSEGYPTESFENAVNDAIAEWETKQGG